MSFNRIWFLMPRHDTQEIPFLITLSARALSAIWFALSLIALSIDWLFDFSVGDADRTQILYGGQRRLHHQTHGSTSQQSSIRKQTKRVSFAHTTTVVQSREREHIVSKSAEYDTSSSSLASSTTIVVAPLRTNRPEIMKEPMATSDLAAPKVHDSTWLGDVLPSEHLQGKALSIGTSERQPIVESRTSLGASDSRSSSPVERVSRRIRSLRLPSKKSCPLTNLKPKRAHTLPTCAFRKVRRTDPVPRTSPYEAPYFATPPAPVYDEKKPTPRSKSAHWQTK